MFITHLFVRVPNWKQLRCPLNKLWCVYTMEYYSAMKKEMVHAATWVGCIYANILVMILCYSFPGGYCEGKLHKDYMMSSVLFFTIACKSLIISKKKN